MKLFLFSVFNFYILSVHSFFYTLLPLTVIKNDTTYKAYCPWNKTTDTEIGCKVNKNVMGYYKKKTATSTEGTGTTDDLPEPKEFLNPALQKKFTQDHCASLKTGWSSKKDNGTVCNKYSFCHNVADDKCVCSCQNGFFGNPYEGCKQHCVTDDDCSSPLATCSKDNKENELMRCVCKQGYSGDGVMCYKDVCGDNRRTKCGADAHKVCVPTGSGPTDYACICEPGYFLDHENKCKEEYTVKENTVITLVGKNVKNGSRIELGDCLSFVINDTSKSIFFHKNSGDSIYVRNPIINNNQFSIFFVVTKEVLAYSSVSETTAGLTKLYSITNTFGGCKFGNARIFDTEGHDLTEEDGFLDVSHKATGSGTGVGGVAGVGAPDAAAAAAAAAALQVSTLEKESFLEVGEVSPKPQVTSSSPSPEAKAVVEVYVRDLKEEEKAGGLPGAVEGAKLMDLTTEESASGLELGSSVAKSHPSPSHLQMSLTPDPSRPLDL